MTPETFKPVLERDKVFLEELYSSQSAPNTKRLLNNASDRKLDTIIRLLHFISTGSIKIKREHFDEMPKRCVNLMRKSFEKKTAVRALLKSERLPKLKMLSKLATVFPQLLYPLFNES